MVNVCPLVVVEIFGFWIPGEQRVRKFKHVVGATCFACVRGELLAEGVGRGEIFVVADATNSVHVAICNCIPEVVDAFCVIAPVFGFGEGGESDYFWYLGVSVGSSELINALGEGVEVWFVVEFLGQSEEFFFASEGGKLCEGFVHAAVFAAEHFCPLLFSEVFGEIDGPFSEFFRDG